MDINALKPGDFIQNLSIENIKYVAKLLWVGRDGHFNARLLFVVDMSSGLLIDYHSHEIIGRMLLPWRPCVNLTQIEKLIYERL